MTAVFEMEADALGKDIELLQREIDGCDMPESQRHVSYALIHLLQATSKRLHPDAYERSEGRMLGLRAFVDIIAGRVRRLPNTAEVKKAVSMLRIAQSLADVA